jgi:outer membrane protein
VTDAPKAHGVRRDHVRRRRAHDVKRRTDDRETLINDKTGSSGKTRASGVAVVLVLGLILTGSSAAQDAVASEPDVDHAAVMAAVARPGADDPAGGPLRLTLDDAIGIALERGHELGMAEAAEEAARSRLWQARSAFLPAVSASASYTRLDEAPYMDASQFGNMFAPLMVPFEYLVEQGYLDPSTLEGLSGGTGSDRIYLGDDDIYSVGITVTQPIFTGGALLGANAAAGHGLHAAELNTRRTRDETRYNVTQAYVMLVQAKAAHGVMDDAVAQMQEHLDNLEAMYKAGMVLERDIMQARVQMSAIELDRNTASHAVRLTGAALAFQLGLDPGTRVEAIDALERTPGAPAELDDLMRAALNERPDLLSMNESVGAADNIVGMARSEFFPQVVAMGHYNWDRPNREYEPEFYDHWSVTVAAQMNVFDWGGRWNRVREAKATRLQAERGLKMLEDAVRLEVEASWQEHDAALSAISIAERGVEQARESYRVTEESFKNGVATNSDVLDANTALRTAEMNRVAALARLRLAEAGLDLAAGVVSE